MCNSLKMDVLDDYVYSVKGDREFQILYATIDPFHI
jgi:hypothetical protein